MLAQLEQRLGGVFLLAGGQHGSEIAILLQQLGGGLGADAGHPLDVGATDAGQGPEVHQLGRGHPVLLLDEGGIQPALVEVVADPDLRADELAEALVGGDDGRLMAVLGNAAGQGGDEIVRLVGLGEQGIDAALPEGILQGRQAFAQLGRHGCAPLLVGGIDLLAPAVHLAIEHCDDVGGLAAGQQLAAGIDEVSTGGDQRLGRSQRLLSLHRVQPADEVEGIDDEQVWPGV